MISEIKSPRLWNRSLVWQLLHLSVKWGVLHFDCILECLLYIFAHFILWRNTVVSFWYSVQYDIEYDVWSSLSVSQSDCFVLQKIALFSLFCVFVLFLQLDIIFLVWYGKVPLWINTRGPWRGLCSTKLRGSPQRIGTVITSNFSILFRYRIFVSFLKVGSKRLKK